MSAVAALRAPRALLHRGTVEVAALWFDPELLGEAQARARVLAEWVPAASVYALAGGWLLRLPAPRRLACESAPGLPLTLEGAVLCAAPLTAAEHERLAPPAGSVVLVRAGRVQVWRLEPAQRVDPATWLQVRQWQVVEVEGLGAPPLPPEVVAEPVAAPARELLGARVPQLAPEAEAMIARMEGREPPALPKAPGLLERLRAWASAWRTRRSAAEATARVGAQGASAGRAVQSLVPGAGGGLLSRLRAWLRGRGTERALPEGAAPAQQQAPVRQAVARPPSGLARALAWVRQALGVERRGGEAAEPPPQPAPSGLGALSRLGEWLLRSTPLGAVLGRRKAEYVQRLFELFESGNLEEALRYAIPLGKGEPSESARVALGLPGPREKLEVRPRAGGAASVFGGGQEVYEALQERYRAAFRRLEREGKIEEAAFVLAELLREDAEAVSFLERHGRLKLAAELAEGRGLAPGLVVRQWLLAKEVSRAVAIARRTGAFADAVLRLERTHPKEARTLRLLWAEVLAEAGHYARAVEVAWPLVEARPLALRWMEWGVEAGGVSGAVLLARLVVAFPERYEQVRSRVEALLEPEGPEAASVRLALAEALGQDLERGAPQAQAQALLKPVLRALVADRAVGHLAQSSTELERLARLTGDLALRADLPRLPAPPPPRALGMGGRPEQYTFGEAEGGPWPVYDAVGLPGGRLLVALGEAGARMVNAEGRCVAHFDVPAFSLVPSLHKDRALALAPRGELHRISRLDLTQRRALAWCDARVEAYAPRYDGDLWFVSVEDTVLAVDALASDWRTLWRVPEVGGRVQALSPGADTLSFVTVRAEGELERWTYALPGPTLRSRQVVAADGGLLVEVSLRPEGELVAVDLSPERGGDTEAAPAGSLLQGVRTSLRWLGPYTGRTLPLPPVPTQGLLGLTLGGMLMAARRSTERGCEVLLLERLQGQVRAQLLFEGKQPVRVRFAGAEVLLFDGLGRLVRVEPAQGRVQRVVLR